MCKPVWSNLKRVAMREYGVLPEGCICRLTVLSFYPSQPVRMLRRLHQEGGTLFLVQVLPDAGISAWRGVRALWYPTYGSGGWVDTNLDAEVGKLCRELDQQLEAEVVNCLAL